MRAELESIITVNLLALESFFLNEFLSNILSLADGTVTLYRNVGTKPIYAAKQPRRVKIRKRRGERLKYGIIDTCRLTY